MLIAELIYPDNIKKRKIQCAECGLEYSKAEYSLLFNSFKLAYFTVSSTEFPVGEAVICHDCLFSFVLDCSDPEESEYINFKIYTKENEYDFSFEPEDFEEISFEDENGNSSGLETFLEVIIKEED